MQDDDRRVIVIGSGPCGAMAAAELVRQGIPVVMLEAGRDTPSGMLVRMAGRNVYRRISERGFHEGSRHIAAGDPLTRWYSNLSPGGLSNQWTAAVPRFDPEDFREGEAIHERYRWPLDYDDLTQFYERAERVMGISAAPEAAPLLPLGYADYRVRIPRDWEAVAKVAAKGGQGLTMLPLADGPPWMIVRRGTYFNSFTNLVRPLLRSSRFRLITRACALQLEWSGAEKRVTGVVYADTANGSQERISGAAVVVACGPLDSTSLLLNSSSTDFPDGLGNTEGLVGKYLHDHAKEWWACDLDRPIDLPSPSIYLTRVPHAKTKHPLLATSWTVGNVSAMDKLRSLLSLKARTLGVQVFGTVVPEVSHCVTLDSEKRDPFGLPLLRINIEYNQDVICNMVDAREQFVSILGEAGYRATIREVPPQLFPGVSVHYAGTVRMHSSRKHGVLDAWNRVYDAPNVIVADASCFTTGPEKNPTLTAMALAARAADRLANDLKSGS